MYIYHCSHVIFCLLVSENTTFNDIAFKKGQQVNRSFMLFLIELLHFPCFAGGFVAMRLPRFRGSIHPLCFLLLHIELEREEHSSGILLGCDIFHSENSRPQPFRPQCGCCKEGQTLALKYPIMYYSSDKHYSNCSLIYTFHYKKKNIRKQI